MEIIKLAVQNHRRYKIIYRSCTISIFVSVFLILFFFSIFKGATYIVNNEVDKNYTFKELTISSMFTEIDENKAFFSDQNLIDLGKLDNVNGIVVNNRISTEISRLFISGKEITVPDYLTGINVNYNTFSSAKVESLKAVNNNFRVFLSGRDFISSDREVAVIDEASVYMLGITDVSQIINEQVEIVLADGREFKVTIIGVYSKLLGDNSLTNSEEGLFYTEDGILEVASESIILSSDQVDKINGGSEYPEITLSINDLESTLEIASNLKSRFYNDIIFEFESINKTLDYLQLFSAIFIFLGSLMLILTLLNLYSTIVMVAENRKKWFSLQTILGFNKTQIVLCYLIEVIVAVTKGIIYSVLGVFLFSFGAYFIIQNVYSEYLAIKISVFFPSFNLMAVLLDFIIIFILLISINISSKINKLNVIKVLL